MRHGTVLLCRIVALFKSQLVLGGRGVSDECKKRVANMHFYMPPDQLTVGLMTCGDTDTGLLEMLKEVLKGCGMFDGHRRQSTGFVSP